MRILVLGLFIVGCGAADVSSNIAARGLASAGCGLPATAGLHRGSLTVGGQTRLYEYSVPANYNAAAQSALVFGFHGCVSPSCVAGNAYCGADAFRNGHPGVLRGWSSQVIGAWMEGQQDPQLSWCVGWPNHALDNSDQAFFDAVLAQLEATLCIDPTRVFATGFSSGSGMTYALAVTRAAQLRGVAPVGLGIPSAFLGTAPANPVALLAMGNMNDSGYADMRHAADLFLSYNGCSSVTQPWNSALADESLAYQGCQAPVVTEFGPDGGHLWLWVPAYPNDDWDGAVSAFFRGL